MHILYISTLTSENLYNSIFNNPKLMTNQQSQKFNRLIVDGLSKNGIEDITLISVLPLNQYSHKNFVYFFNPEQYSNITYKYVPSVKLGALRFIINVFYVFLYTLTWSLKGRRKVILIDILNLSQSVGLYLFSKFSKIARIAIVTDIPGKMISAANDRTIKKALYTFFSRQIITRYDGYVLLTEMMNKVVNPTSKPYIILEALTPVDIRKVKLNGTRNSSPKVILYSGGIHKGYGVENLLKAFVMYLNSNVELHIYGSGDLENEIALYMARDKRIRYFGTVQNNVLMERLKKATLLINPRPTDEVFTKYSFPSKVIEYMASGTPTATTLLEGIPGEYFKYLIPIEDHSPLGILKTIDSTLERHPEEIKEIGDRARKFVIHSKNNVSQAAKIVSLISKVCSESSS